MRHSTDCWSERCRRRHTQSDEQAAPFELQVCRHFHRPGEGEVGEPPRQLRSVPPAGLRIGSCMLALHVLSIGVLKCFLGIAKPSSISGNPVPDGTDRDPQTARDLVKAWASGYRKSRSQDENRRRIDERSGFMTERGRAVRSSPQHNGGGRSHLGSQVTRLGVRALLIGLAGLCQDSGPNKSHWPPGD
jgi:hypothetical protein